MTIPNEEDFKAIRKWPAAVGWNRLLDFVQSRWKYCDKPGVWEISAHNTIYRYRISTMGWPDNENLIWALESNAEFWADCYASSHVDTDGNHYKFETKMEKYHEKT